MTPLETLLLERIRAAGRYRDLSAALQDAHGAIPLSDGFVSQLILEIAQARRRLSRLHLIGLEASQVALSESQRLLRRPTT